MKDILLNCFIIITVVAIIIIILAGVVSIIQLVSQNKVSTAVAVAGWTGGIWLALVIILLVIDLFRKGNYNKT